MDTGLDLTTASREALLALIARQQAVIAQLQRRLGMLGLDVLEGKAKPGGHPECPALSRSPARVQSGIKGPGPTALPASAWPPPTGWSMSCNPVPNAVPAWSGAGYSGPVKSLTYP